MKLSILFSCAIQATTTALGTAIPDTVDGQRTRDEHPLGRNRFLDEASLGPPGYAGNTSDTPESGLGITTRSTAAC
jgi:hypothetical protein